MLASNVLSTDIFDSGYRATSFQLACFVGIVNNHERMFFLLSLIIATVLDTIRPGSVDTYP